MVILNLIICSLIGMVCICRLGAMSERTTKRVVRLKYELWFILAAVSGWSHLMGHPAEPMQLMMSLGVLIDLLIGFPVWRHGPPAYTVKG